MIETEVRPNALTVWFGALSGITSELSVFWNLLDADEKRRALNIKNPLGKQRYVETHGRLRVILAETVDAPPESLVIARTEHGKPYLADYPSVAFNLSHADDHIAIALGNQCRIGIDIETCKPRMNLPALVDKCFGTIEANYWRTLPDEQKLQAFYAFWTRKEAFVKAVGYGISLGLRQCVIDPDDPNRMLSVPAICGKAEDWSLCTINSTDNIRCAIAVDVPIRAVKVNGLNKTLNIRLRLKG